MAHTPPTSCPCAECVRLFAAALEAVLVALEVREGPVISPLVERLRALQNARAAVRALNEHLAGSSPPA